MKSTSKIIIGRETLERISRRSLGRGLAGSREITQGWFNTIHLLELEDGSRAVLKVSPPPGFATMRYEKDIMSAEVAVHRRLAEAGLCVPRVLADSPEGEFIGHHWFIMDYLDGKPLGELRRKLPRRARDLIDEEVAAQSAAVNGIGGTRFGRWRKDGTASTSWAESFLAMVEDLFADARDRSVGLPAGEAELRALFGAARPALELVKSPRLVLWDLHDGNVIARVAPPGLLGFIDTDRALWGDPLLEFYFRRIARVSPAWLAAYKKNAGDGEGELDGEGARVRSALYEVYLGLVMVIETAYRQYSKAHDAMVRLYCAASLSGLRKALR
jgi:aminoglycoside phosphotransferase (APT) family kinase protein